MGLVDVLSLVLLLLFGVLYISKLVVLLVKNRVHANVLGRGEKGSDILITERLLQAVTFIGFGVWMIDALFPGFAAVWFVRLYQNLWLGYGGLAVTLCGLVLFALTMLTMKTSWRVGIDKVEKTSLVTSGLFAVSRNPAFVGMDLMFAGIAVTHLNVLTVLAAVLVAAVLHLQIRQEEKHLAGVFGSEYIDYMKKSPRYLFACGRFRAGTD
jgi:protein-S-isoprenylcysteine O-methyltransferase Ste14